MGAEVVFSGHTLRHRRDSEMVLHSYAESYPSAIFYSELTDAGVERAHHDKGQMLAHPLNQLLEV